MVAVDFLDLLGNPGAVSGFSRKSKVLSGFRADSKGTVGGLIALHWEVNCFLPTYWRLASSVPGLYLGKRTCLERLTVSFGIGCGGLGLSFDEYLCPPKLGMTGATP